MGVASKAAKEVTQAIDIDINKPKKQKAETKPTPTPYSNTPVYTPNDVTIPKEGLNTVELFAGQGSPSIAMKDLGIPVKSNEVVEWDNKKVNIYNDLHGTNYESSSVTDYHLPTDKVTDIVFTGSPCTSFSTIGKREGGELGSGTPSSLMWETTRMVEELPFEGRPKVIMFENVDGMISKSNKKNYQTYLSHMDDLGYDTVYNSFKASDYGGVQHRPRVYTMHVKRGENISFDFNNMPQDKSKVFGDIMEQHDLVDDKFFVKPSQKWVSDRIGTYLKVKTPEDKLQTITKKQQRGNNAGMIAVDDGILRPGKSVFDVNGQKQNLRFLTPREQYRATGISDEWFDKIQHHSLLNLEAAIGDTMSVDVLKSILTELYKLPPGGIK